MENPNMHRLACCIAAAVAALTAGVPLSAQSHTDGDGAVVEVRSYNLKPGTRERFHERLVNEALPMLQRWQVDVIAYGPSLHDRDSDSPSVIANKI